MSGLAMTACVFLIAAIAAIAVLVFDDDDPRFP